ncbi:putative nuclease HARBI1 [Cotesia glomerata]|uniref:putative nuclease HARBI1 n=1 Tax=Cotesia glomerata TaxID=32391 RepID=UPI001D028F6F|nr:putative nuclease HARBI1 [Cotesia glomerata]
MADEYDYQLWIYQCQKIIRQAQIKKKIRRKRIICALLCNEIVIQRSKKKYTPKKFWIHPLFKLRREHGFFEAVFPTLSSYSEKIENYIRMTAVQFEQLLYLVGPKISKQKVIREPISAPARLAMTLRFLATGDCMSSISYQYLVGLTTTANIITETCEALWSCLKEKVLPYPLNEADWLKISIEFEKQWQFPHCIGAIDGKHIHIQCPDNAGSSYYNYKNSHSIVLMAICDANYLFTFIDVGAYGRRSDGGIFRDSAMGRKFRNNEMNIPKPDLLTVDGLPQPYVLVGDEAFQLTNYLLRPYPGRSGLNMERSIYNYRLSRARRTIENSFGIIVSLWRILKKPIDATVENTISIIQAIICLHNWLRKHDEDDIYIPPNLVDQEGPNGIIPGSWRHEVNFSALKDRPVQGNNFSSRSAIAVRDDFCEYFNAEGAVPWQYSRN